MLKMDGRRVQGFRVQGFQGFRVLGLLFLGSCRHRDALSLQAV